MHYGAVKILNDNVKNRKCCKNQSGRKPSGQKANSVINTEIDVGVNATRA